MINKDWVYSKLSEIGEIYSGGTPKTSQSEYWLDEISWITPADLSKYSNKYIEKGRKSISEVGLRNSSAKLLPIGTILFSSRAPIGYVVIAKKELSTNQGFKNIYTCPGVTSEYVYYYLRASRQLAESKASGTTFKEISKQAFSELPIPVSPLPIQRAIVARIEELLSELDQGIADLRRAQAQLKVYREAVLKKAFEGKLTNVQMTKGVKIGSVTEINPKLENKNLINADFEVQFVPMKLVEEVNNKIHLNEVRTFGEIQGKSYTYFADGDVIFAKVTPCMENGKIAVANDLRNGIAYGSSEFHVFRCGTTILNTYLFYFLVQERFRKDSEQAMTGAVGLRRVPVNFLKDYEIPMPEHITKQVEVVKEIESRLSVCDTVEQTIKESLSKAEALRQSILKKAFEGKLLTQEEITRCEQESDYEPASVLLERIKQEKRK